MLSTTNPNSTANTNLSSLFRRRSNRLSNLSVSTLPPVYDVADNIDEPCSSESAPTGNENATANPTGSPASSFFRNRFSNASLLSLSSVRTLLPQYSPIDTLGGPTGNPLSEVTTRFELGLGDPQGRGFRYSYPIKPKNPWATLHLHTRGSVPGNSRPLGYQPRVPKIWSCDPLSGTVQLDLDSPQNIQQISITIKGTIVLSSHSGGSLPFLSREFTVWDNSMGDPLQSENANSTLKKKVDSRLASGKYTFPFSFPFPTHADPIKKSSDSTPDTNSISPFRPQTVFSTTQSNVSSPTPPPYDNGPNNTEKPQRLTPRLTNSESSSSSTSSRLQMSGPSEPSRSFVSPIPQTFMEKGIDPNVAYDISVRIVHGRFKTSSKIKTNIAYLPASEPLPVSQKRREAYEAGALLPCPMDDPEGWFALPTVKTYGMVKIDDKLLHTRVDCTLYIAQPLTYTRGSHIPCFITIHSDGVEAVDLLASTDRPTMRLLRRVWHPVADHDIHPSRTLHDHSAHTSWTYVSVVPTSDLCLVCHEVGHADWWIPSKDIVQGPNSRHLEGEIHLSPDLQPSSGFQSFRIEYAVELLSFQTANFTPEVHPSSPGMITRKGDDNVIASKLVEITTLYRQDEPVPAAYSEPPATYSKRLVSSIEGAKL